MDVSRRSIFGLAAATTAAAALAPRATAATTTELPRFGSKPGEARLMFNENPYGPSPAAIAAMAETASKGCYYVDDIEPARSAHDAEYVQRHERQQKADKPAPKCALAPPLA